ncbi:hypothetical protein C2E23DRAFT_834811 [Lenzites betulinus]|nr:hypothetical protein C2E23DRAFT_834811 [Lenzites betulinus]
MSFASNLNGWDDETPSATSFSQPDSVPPEWHTPSNPPAYLLSSPSPSPALQSPKPRKKAAGGSRKAAKMPGHIPRPRNAFMIFRSECSTHVKEQQIEHDHRIISKILGNVWRELPADKKAEYQLRAAEEKREHRLKYPFYRFTPQQRTEKAKKRNVKRNGATDRQRCEKVARLLLEGKGGDVLKAEVDKFDRTTRLQHPVESHGEDYSTGMFDSREYAWQADSPATSDDSSMPSSPSTSSCGNNLYPESPAIGSPLSPHPSISPAPMLPPSDMPEPGPLDNFVQACSLQSAPIESQAQGMSFSQVFGGTGGMNFSGDYQSLHPAGDPGLGLELPYAQPQCELGPNQLYPPHMAPLLAPAPQRPLMGAGTPYTSRMQSPINRGYPRTSYAPQAPAQPELPQSFSSMEYPIVNAPWCGTTQAFPQQPIQQGAFDSAQFANAQGYQFDSAHAQAQQAPFSSAGWTWSAGSNGMHNAPAQGQPQSAPAGWEQY